MWVEVVVDVDDDVERSDWERRRISRDRSALVGAFSVGLIVLAYAFYMAAGGALLLMGLLALVVLAGIAGLFALLEALERLWRWLAGRYGVTVEYEPDFEHVVEDEKSGEGT
jgi:hypothetical protein